MNKKVWMYAGAYGLFSFISSYLMYNSIGGMWTNMGLGFLVLMIMSVVYVKELRKDTGASPFKDIVKDLFIIALVSMLISLVLTQAYLACLSEDDMTLMEENFVQSQIDTYSSFGIPEEAMNDMEDELLKSADKMFSIKSTLMSMPFVLGFMLLIFIVIGLIMKRDPDINAQELVDN